MDVRAAPGVTPNSPSRATIAAEGNQARVRLVLGPFDHHGVVLRR
ncbi:hypothetical protein ACIBO2_39790 [Nonomuraea sp. NPDC050022]